MSRLVGGMLRWFRQPAVIGEVVAGLLLGPSLLGWLAPGLQAMTLPPDVIPCLGTLAQLAVILFMFLTGIELNTDQVGKNLRQTLGISFAGILTPFTLGFVLAVVIHPTVGPSEVSVVNFAMFAGVAMSITAFPVLARILTERNMQRTHVGALAMACAAASDAFGWCLLAIVIGVVRSDLGSALYTFGLTAGYVAAMLLIVRPLLLGVVERVERRGALTTRTTSSIILGLLVSAYITDSIGVHALFGAFVFGVLIPHHSLLARELTRSLEDIVVVALLPVFFAFTGLRTQLDILGSSQDLLLLLSIIAVACIGKVGGTALAARFSRLSWRDASALGVLMNTRGLMELIVLNLGLDLGIISQKFFGMMVVMAVVTTAAAEPLLHLLERKSQRTPQDEPGKLAPSM